MNELVLGCLIGLPSGVASVLLWLLVKSNDGDVCECECAKCGKPRA